MTSAKDTFEVKMHTKNEQQKKENKKMDETENEIKILHIHKASDNHEDFIEFLLIRNGKTQILRENGFIRRYGNKAIQEFKMKKGTVKKKKVEDGKRPDK